MSFSIYSVIVDNQVIYIGSTKNMKQRKHAHTQHRFQSKYSHSILYCYLNYNEVPVEDVEYKVLKTIEEESEPKFRQYLEQVYINEYNPTCNSINSMSSKKFKTYQQSVTA